MNANNSFRITREGCERKARAMQKRIESKLTRDLLLSVLQQNDVLYMLGVGEHIHGLDLGYTVGAVKHGEVARLGGGITTDIYDTLRLGAEDSGDHILVHAGTRRVGDDNIRTAVLLQESVVEHIFHVAGKEQSVRYAVDLGVDLGILDRLGPKLAIVPVPV